MSDPRRPDEPTRHRAARLDDTVARTVVAVLRRRGWVERVEPYTGYGGPGWVRVMARVLLAPPGTTAGEVRAQDRTTVVRGWRAFLSAQVPHVEVELRVGDVVRRVRADRGGYVDAVVEVRLPPGRAAVTITVGGRSAEAPVVVVGPDPVLGLLSDIDDTVMVTALPRPLIAAWNAFVLHEHARRAVPGMAQLYRRWLDANPGSPVVYLSTGAWNVAPALHRFLGRHDFPYGPLLLTDWGPTTSGWFRSGPAHKRASLERLLTELPQVTWLLVGDDGQHDPELYDEATRAYPERVLAVAIRRLSPGEALLAHGVAVPTGDEPPTSVRPVVTGGDGFELTLRLQDAGLLAPHGSLRPGAPREERSERDAQGGDPPAWGRAGRGAWLRAGRRR